MIVILFLIPISIVLATGFLLAFIWAVRSGQYEDTQTPSLRLLLEEKRNPKPELEVEATKVAKPRNEQQTANPE